jgi:hypothetical protein
VWRIVIQRKRDIALRMPYQRKLKNQDHHRLRTCAPEFVIGENQYRYGRFTMGRDNAGGQGMAYA